MNYLDSFIAALLITPVMRKIALRFGIIDRPSGDRLKIHAEPVALLGGGSVVIAAFIGTVLLKLALPGTAFSFIWFILAVGVVVFTIGLWDDITPVKPAVRLTVHAAVGCIILAAYIFTGSAGSVVMGLVLPVCVVAMINAFNMIDGMDGLCAGLAFIICIGFFFVGRGHNNVALMILSGTLSMSLLGFLLYNFYPAKIFLGDSGSGFIGYCIGIMTFMAAVELNVAGKIALLLIVSIPLADICFAMVRRLIQKKPLFSGDRDHLYDLLLRNGFSQVAVWSLLCGLQSLLVIAGVTLIRL